MLKFANIQPVRVLLSCLLVFTAALAVIPQAFLSTSPADVSTTEVAFSPVVKYCSEGSVEIPFTGTVTINVNSASGPLDMYVVTKWFGEGQESFDSVICFLGHPTSSSQNCGIIYNPPQCVFAESQVNDSSFGLHLPPVAMAYYIILIQCCVNPSAASNVTLVMTGTVYSVSVTISPYTLMPTFASSLMLSPQNVSAALPFPQFSNLSQLGFLSQLIGAAPELAVPIAFNIVVIVAIFILAERAGLRKFLVTRTYCVECGHAIGGNVAVCENCGAEQP